MEFGSAVFTLKLILGLVRVHLKMPISGLTCNPLKIYCFTTSVACPNSAFNTLTSLCKESVREQMMLLCSTKREHWTIPKKKALILKTRTIKNGIYASFGDEANNYLDIFPRIHIKDPYKRLGISREASEEEIQAARNFLMNKYAGHKPSVDAIESAHDKIIMKSFLDRRNPKLNIKKKIKEVTQSRFVQAITTRFQTPATSVIVKTSIAFMVLGVLTVLFPTEEGPTFQVAISLILSIYFIFDRLKSRLRACIYGAGSFFLSWFLGTFLMVSVIPPMLKGPNSLEVTTALISYVLLWISSTYLK
ncbi:hypothetical protein HPP92_014462 [Vanilla planifolia]|uniref:Protein CHAPERONE-LIKE PROTEIN OF POR1, chloroplastic n=1 Tax=Vanilla planifolia TaxID=51239 RepID=A0A835QLJ2_VANPL|nr:hypothetical protein HPP92_014462 [Vanilla planifolia]